MAAAFDAPGALGATLAGAMALDPALAAEDARDAAIALGSALETDAAEAGTSPEMPVFPCMRKMLLQVRRQGKRKMRLR